MVIWAAIGGRNSLIGAIAGALLVNFAKDKISTAMPEVWLYGLGALFIAAVTILPQGLAGLFGPDHPFRRSEEHTSELQSLMRISYAVFCLKKKKNNNASHNTSPHRQYLHT